MLTTEQYFKWMSIREIDPITTNSLTNFSINDRKSLIFRQEYNLM